MKRLTLILVMFLTCSLFLPAGAFATDNLLIMTDANIDKILPKLTKLDLNDNEDLEKGREYLDRLDVGIVKLSGKLNHFGYDIINGGYIDYHATVPFANVWIAEYPFTKEMNFQSDETGWWTIFVVKTKTADLEFSYVYEKAGWITTKSNVIPVTDEDNTDIAIQYIDPLYFNLAMVPMVEAMVTQMTGMPFTFVNAMVVTVGKSWASMHSDLLPHGDPGATVSSNPPLYFPAAIGPLYFNEQVQPDPAWWHTSVDGGVAWVNVPLNSYDITAQKEGVNYKTVRFNMTEADAENGVVLYIASPPDSVEGDNDSAPGEW